MGHGVAPLLYRSLQEVNERACVPERAFDRLEKHYYATAARNLKLFQKLKGILEAFQGVGVEVLVLKGPVLASLIYPGMALRPIGDLDLLIHPEDFQKARQALAGLGYILNPSVPSLKGSELVEYAHYFSQIRFLSKSGPLIETHFCLVNIGVPREDTERIWRRGLEFEGPGFKARMPSFEDILIHLCLHAAQHNFYRLLLFCDIAGLLHKYGALLDWVYVMEAVQTRRMQSLVYHSLIYSQQLFDVRVPEAVLSALKPGFFRRKTFEVVWGEGRILSLHKRKRPASLEAVFCYLAEMDGPASKLLYLYRVLCPRPRWLSAYFSRSVSGLTYMVYLFQYLFGTTFKAASQVKPP
jgi:hypothetical protein